MTVTYRVCHKTVYGYSIPVTLSHHLARLKPRETPYQHVISSNIALLPEASFQTDQTDAFGNTATFLIVETPHNEMSVISDFTAQISAPAYPDATQTPSWEETADLLRFPKTAEQLDASEMTCPSCFVPLTKEIKQYAAPSFKALAKSFVVISLHLTRTVERPLRI